jgi:hypothetical protein
MPMAISETTVVTAFYPLKKSKHDIGKYRAWIQNFCKIPCTMVIFTTEVYALEMYQWRKEYLDQTKIIVRPFDTFAMSCPSMMAFWEKQWEKDPEKDIHSPELYAVWAMKQELVRIIVNMNPFQSMWFVWCDMGIQRYSAMQQFYNTFPSDVGSLCKPGRMTFLEINKIPDTYFNDWKESKPMMYPVPGVTLGGGCIAGDADAWKEFGDAYISMLQEFAVRDWFAGKDQIVFFTILMERKTKPFRLFHAKKFGVNNTLIPGIDWMSFPVMLGGQIDAPLDIRFEEYDL